MSAEEEMLLDTFLIEGISYWLGLFDLDHEGSKLNSFKEYFRPCEFCRDLQMARKSPRGRLY